MRLKINDLIMIGAFITLTVLALVCSGCSEPQDKNPSYLNVENNVLVFPLQFHSGRIETVKYDGCEYVVLAGWQKIGSITHKGNCNNPIHKVIK